jgi:hypothetical protein
MDNFCEIEIRQPDKKVKSLFRTKLIKQPPKVQGLLFDLYAWFLLWQVYAWDFEALSKKTTDELSSGMLYTGALSWNRFHGVPVDYTKADVEAWIDDIPTGKMKEIGRVLMASMKVMEEIKAGAGVGEKKK